MKQPCLSSSQEHFQIVFQCHNYVICFPQNRLSKQSPDILRVHFIFKNYNGTKHFKIVNKEEIQT